MDNLTDIKFANMGITVTRGDLFVLNGQVCTYCFGNTYTFGINRYNGSWNVASHRSIFFEILCECTLGMKASHVQTALQQFLAIAGIP